MDYESWELPIGLLEFIPSTHTYIFNGEIIPSVTQIMRIKFNDKYLGVPQSTLDMAGELGIEMHKIIQDYEELNIDDKSNLELQNYKFLKKYYKWETIRCEVPVVILVDNKAICGGRIDLFVKSNGDLGIIDLKRTSVFDKEYVTYQTNLYRLGMKCTYNKDIKFVSGVHLRNDKRKYITLTINEERTYKLIKEWNNG